MLRALLFSKPGCIAMGVAAAYYGDARLGPQRRRALRDRAGGLFGNVGHDLRRSVGDAGNRAVGLVARTRSHLTADEADDRTLCARVRSTLGRAVARPRDVKVSAHRGVVTLYGTPAAGEADRLLAAVAGVRGVLAVEDRLDAPADGPGSSSAPEQHVSDGRPAPGGATWTPAVRLLAGGGGAYLALWGAWRRGIIGLAGTAAGLCLVSRAVNNPAPIRRVGERFGPRAVVGLRDSAAADTPSLATTG